MITDAEKSQIKVLLQSPQWATIERMIEIYSQSIRDQSCLRDTEWETAKTVAFNEGQMSGIKKFVSALYKETT